VRRIVRREALGLLVVFLCAREVVALVRGVALSEKRVGGGAGVVGESTGGGGRWGRGSGGGSGR
jgi:hypothetical protein